MDRPMVTGEFISDRGLFEVIIKLDGQEVHRVSTIDDSRWSSLPAISYVNGMARLWAIENGYEIEFV